MKKKKDEPKAEPSAWTKGTNIKGIVPPGRRLSDEKRKTSWSASGVKGVTPPGTLGPDEGPSVDWSEKEEKKKEKKVRDNKRAMEKAKAKKQAAIDPMRPVEGFVANPFADLQDPSEMKSFLRRINDFLEEKKPPADLAQAFASLIIQSHAPFDIMVGFTILSALIGKSTQLRRRYAVPLERGAKVYFNLITRLEKNVQVPRGLVPETVNALFYDLPQLALQVPYAYAAHAFVRQMELLRDGFNPDGDRAIAELGQELYDRYIVGRSIGDRSMVSMFPYEPPEW